MPAGCITLNFQISQLFRGFPKTGSSYLENWAYWAFGKEGLPGVIWVPQSQPSVTSTLDPQKLRESSRPKLKATVCSQAGRQNFSRGICRHPRGNTSGHLAALENISKSWRKFKKKNKNKNQDITRMHIPQVTFHYLCLNLEINTIPISKANEEICLNLHLISWPRFLEVGKLNLDYFQEHHLEDENKEKPLNFT